MKILIKASTNTGWIYHCTKSEEAAESIIEAGFNTKEVSLTSSLDQAQGYGPICIRAKLSDLAHLNICDINEDYSFDPKKYPPECQGIKEPVKGELGKYIYYIWEVSTLNATVKFERYPEGDR